MTAFYLFIGDRYVEPESAQFPVSKELHNDNSLTIIDPMVDIPRSLVRGHPGVGAG